MPQSVLESWFMNNSKLTQTTESMILNIPITKKLFPRVGSLVSYTFTPFESLNRIAFAVRGGSPLDYAFRLISEGGEIPPYIIELPQIGILVAKFHLKLKGVVDSASGRDRISSNV